MLLKASVVFTEIHKFLLSALGELQRSILFIPIDNIVK
jgi:hypothetical protein